MIKTASTPEDLRHCYPAIHALRTQLSLETFLERVPEMWKENYQIIYLEEEGEAVAACGFRYVTSLYEGPFIYIDDLSTVPAYQGKGYGDQLFNYVVNLAKSKGLNAVHLDSGHHRYDAHRFYLKHGMQIVYHHFRLGLG